MMAISRLMIEAFVSLQKGWKTSDGKGEPDRTDGGVAAGVRRRRSPRGMRQ